MDHGMIIHFLRFPANVLVVEALQHFQRSLTLLTTHVIELVAWHLIVEGLIETFDAIRHFMEPSEEVYALVRLDLEHFKVEVLLIELQFVHQFLYLLFI